MHFLMTFWPSPTMLLPFRIRCCIQDMSVRFDIGGGDLHGLHSPWKPHLVSSIWRLVCQHSRQHHMLSASPNRGRIWDASPSSTSNRVGLGWDQDMYMSTTQRRGIGDVDRRKEIRWVRAGIWLKPPPPLDFQSADRVSGRVE